LLLLYSRKSPVKKRDSTSTGLHLSFALFIGLGFMFLEITFIQKFLLILGTPILALKVTLFSILVSGSSGAYLSGKWIFKNRPHKAVFLSIPILAAIILVYYLLLGTILYSSVGMPLYHRVALTFALLCPVGVLMGFQFPSLIKMSVVNSNGQVDRDTTLLWGVNVIASITGTVFAATLAMVIGLNGNLLIASVLYLGALVSAALAFAMASRTQKLVVK